MNHFFRILMNSSINPCLSFVSCENSFFLSPHSLHGMYAGVECWKSPHFSCLTLFYLNTSFHSALNPLSNHILFNQLSCDLPVLSYLVSMSLSSLDHLDLLSIVYESLLSNSLQFLYHSLSFYNFNFSINVPVHSIPPSHSPISLSSHTCTPHSIPLNILPSL